MNQKKLRRENISKEEAWIGAQAENNFRDEKTPLRDRIDNFDEAADKSGERAIKKHRKEQEVDEFASEKFDVKVTRNGYAFVIKGVNDDLRKLAIKIAQEMGHDENVRFIDMEEYDVRIDGNLINFDLKKDTLTIDNRNDRGNDWNTNEKIASALKNALNKI